MNAEIVICKRPWVCARDQTDYLCRPDIEPGRVTITTLTELRIWVNDINGHLRFHGPQHYHLYVKAPDYHQGYVFYDIPHSTGWTGLADKLWHLLDLHIAFEMWKPGVRREHLRDEPESIAVGAVAG